jgi:hypothetical protein
MRLGGTLRRWWCGCAWRAILSNGERERPPGDFMGRVRRVKVTYWRITDAKLVIITFTPVGNDAGSPTAIQKARRTCIKIYIERL